MGRCDEGAVVSLLGMSKIVRDIDDMQIFLDIDNYYNNNSRYTTIFKTQIHSKSSHLTAISNFSM